MLGQWSKIEIPAAGVWLPLWACAVGVPGLREDQLLDVSGHLQRLEEQMLLGCT